MGKIKWTLIGLIITQVLLICPAFAADEWETNIRVSVLNAENKLSFGERSDATRGFDSQYDVPAMLSGDVKAYFLLDEGMNCWRDIKSAKRSGVKSWDMHIESPLIGETVKIKWNPELLPHNLTFKLIDFETGAIVDMKKHNNYSYQNNGERQLRVEVRP